MRVVRTLLVMAADGMAGFLDLAVGALIAFSVGNLYGFEVPLWHLGAGAVLAFLPDLDFLLALGKYGQKIRGDHRLSVMHRPLIMVPLCTVVAGLLGGSYWTITTALCLVWHYNHDSRWLSVSDIDWTWPITNRYLPYMEHPVWRERYWIKPTVLSLSEVAIGTAIVWVLAVTYGSTMLAHILAFMLMCGASCVWLMHSVLQKSEQT